MYRIGIVDDERIVREAISQHIDWARHDIEVAFAASNALEALDRLREEPTDLMLVDIRMPVMDGLELLRRVKEEKPEVEVIILSGYADFTYAREALRYGARDYLLKPLDQEALVNTVAKCRNERIGRELLKESGGDAQENTSARRYSQTVQKILTIVRDELANEELSLKWISSQKLFLNENYLSKVFQKEVGQKFSAYLLEQRMQTAMQYLARGDAQVQEAARVSGFGDNPQYFSSTFKKYTGYTPTEFRKYIRDARG